MHPCAFSSAATVSSAGRPVPLPRRDFVGQLSLATAGLLLAAQRPLQAVDVSPVHAQPLPPFYHAAQTPLAPGPGGIDIRTWVRSRSTGGQFSCVETAVGPRRMGPAPHYHENLDELMLVLEGTATVWMDGKAVLVETGAWHFRPRRIPHTFWNNEERPLRFLDMYFQQNFEDFLEELFHQIIPDMVKAGKSPGDPEVAKRMADLNRRFGVVMFPDQRQPLVERHGLIG